jgi:hypothetical protein
MEQKGSAKPTNSFMETVIGGKTLKGYLTIIKMPLLALMGLVVVNFLLSILAHIPVIGGVFGLMNWVFGAVIALIALIIQGYIGFTAVKKYSGDLLTATVSGAIAGLLMGVVAAISNLILSAITLGMGSVFGAGLAIAGAIMGIFIMPLFWLVTGGIIALIGGALAGARTFGPGGPAQPATKPSA